MIIAAKTTIILALLNRPRIEIGFYVIKMVIFTNGAGLPTGIRKGTAARLLHLVAVIRPDMVIS